MLCSSTQTDVQSIRSRFYGFVQFAPDNDVAVDISFGSVGFTLALARAFRTVSHSFGAHHWMMVTSSLLLLPGGGTTVTGGRGHNT